MVEFFRISLAGINIEIECRDRLIFKQCGRYLSSFDEPDLLVRCTPEEIETEASQLGPMGKTYNGVATSRCLGSCESLVAQHKIADAMPYFNAILAHGAVVALEGQAYMFTAPSGTGKTTRARLWLQEFPGSFVVNGDKPLIKVTDSGVLACGTPWCGKEGWNENTLVPLCAIFLLERADNERESTVVEANSIEALPVLLRQVHKPSDRNGLLKTVALLDNIVHKVGIYTFRSKPTLDAVRLAYESVRSNDS